MRASMTHRAFMHQVHGGGWVEGDSESESEYTHSYQENDGFFPQELHLLKFCFYLLDKN